MKHTQSAHAGVSKKSEFLRTTMTYEKGSDKHEVEFCSPSGLRWTCTQCGRCCRDLENRERRILLLNEDIERIRASGTFDFCDIVDEFPFNGIMKKEDDRCIFYAEGKCKIYHDRALLCEMYPFWVERNGELFIINADDECAGIGEGELLGESFFKRLLVSALKQMDY